MSGNGDCISREAALEECNWYANEFSECEYAIMPLKGALEILPAADVRPVVLCRDCEYSYDSVGGWCCSHGICVDCIVREDFFCAGGEKRKES